MDECRLSRSIGSLAGLFAFLDGFVERQGIPEDAAFDVRLALEELFTNMVKYHPEGGDRILVRLELDGPSVRATLQDFEVDSWDVTRAPEPDVNAPLEARRPGGLGLHLVRKVTDDFRYEYRDRSSTITVTKRIRA
jgi:serine/threonine-protein kinase RsbW